MKSILFILFSITIMISSCYSQEEKDTSIEKSGYLESSVFKDILKEYDDDKDKGDILNKHKVFNFLIGEDEFLYCSQFDFYFIYFYAQFGNDTNFIYSFKQRNGEDIVSVDIKRVVFSKDEKYQSGNTVGGVTKLLELSDVDSLIKKVEYINTLQGNFRPNRYDIPFRLLMYYNGAKYVRLTATELDESELNDLDLLFRTSPLFKEG